MEKYLMWSSLWQGDPLWLAMELGLSVDQVNRDLSRTQEILQVCKRLNLHLLTPHDSCYPKGFFQLSKPPLVLTFRGHLKLLEIPSIAIVGSREPLQWVHRWMEQHVVEWLQKSPWLILSGGARGIDQIAHRLAVRSQSKTIAILPSGLGEIYPRNLHQKFGRCWPHSMGLLSEYLPFQSMRKHFFFRRNQLIASYAQKVFIAQAHQKSGTSMTAQFAVDLGKEIYTLPSAPVEPNCSGNLQLLFDGAHLVRTAQDLPEIHSGNSKVLI